MCQYTRPYNEDETYLNLNKIIKEEESKIIKHTDLNSGCVSINEQNYNERCLCELLFLRKLLTIRWYSIHLARFRFNVQ